MKKIMVIALLLTACSSAQTIENIPTSTITTFPTVTFIPTITPSPTPEVITIDKIIQMSINERLKLLPENQYKQYEKYASNKFPNIIIFFDEQGNAIGGFDILEQKEVKLEVSGLQAYTLLNGEKWESNFVESVPVLLRDGTYETSYTFTTIEDALMFMVNREGVRYSEAEEIDILLNDPRGGGNLTRRTLSRLVVSAYFAGDVTTSDNKFTFELWIYGIDVENSLITYMRYDGYTDYLVITQPPADLAKRLRDGEILIPAVEYDITKYNIP